MSAVPQRRPPSPPAAEWRRNLTTSLAVALLASLVLWLVSGPAASCATTQSPAGPAAAPALAANGTTPAAPTGVPTSTSTAARSDSPAPPFPQQPRVYLYYSGTA
ncbi:hypothetical protein ABPG75_002930 [Micractinium tetrahymenae]